MLSRGGKFLKNLLFPPACPGCGCYVSTEAEWCEVCRKNLLHLRFLDDSRRNRLDGCYALCDYSEPVQRALTHLKYKRKRQYGRAFSDLLEAFPFTRRLEMYDAVVPVPLYPLKERERGFNQNDILFRSWAQRHGYMWLPALQRIRPTGSQVGLARKERQSNLKAAFTVVAGKTVKDCRLLLVDDVYTTGATLQACAAALKRNGAVEVTGLVIASSRN